MQYRYFELRNDKNDIINTYYAKSNRVDKNGRVLEDNMISNLLDQGYEEVQEVVLEKENVEVDF